LEVDTSNLVDRLIVASPSPRMINHPERTGVVRSCDPFKFMVPNHISGTAEVRVVKFCTQVPVRYIKWTMSRNPFLNFGSQVISLEQL